jgi:CBS domain-containing protein
MGWERIRHVPVEDEKGRLVGLVSYRAILRFLTDYAKRPALAEGGPTPQSMPVSDLMQRDLVTVMPDTPTLDAIALMRKHRIGCLPVVQDGHIVAVVTEEDFVGIAGKVLEEAASSTDVTGGVDEGDSLE